MIQNIIFRRRPTTHLVLWCLLTLQYAYTVTFFYCRWRGKISGPKQNQDDWTSVSFVHPGTRRQPRHHLLQTKRTVVFPKKSVLFYPPCCDATRAIHPPAQTLNNRYLLVAATPIMASTRQTFLLRLASQVRTSTRELPPSCHTYGALVTKDIEGAGAGDRIR